MNAIFSTVWGTARRVIAPIAFLLIFAWSVLAASIAIAFPGHAGPPGEPAPECVAGNPYGPPVWVPQRSGSTDSAPVIEPVGADIVPACVVVNPYGPADAPVPHRPGTVHGSR